MTATPEATGLTTGRVQLALNVDDLEQAVTFYTQLFSTAPHKRRPGYANFAIAEPPLKLVLIENPGSGGSLNHLGVEVGTPAEVADATRRFDAAGLTTAVEDATTCCYAVQDKVWATGPGGERWEVYTILDDAPTTASDSSGQAQGLTAKADRTNPSDSDSVEDVCAPGGACCTPEGACC